MQIRGKRIVAAFVVSLVWFLEALASEASNTKSEAASQVVESSSTTDEKGPHAKLDEKKVAVANTVCAVPLDSSIKARECAEHKLKTEYKGLYNFANHANHLGNTGNNEAPCQDDHGAKSYFSTSKPLFIAALQGSTITSCALDINDKTRYRCIGTTSGKACHAHRSPTSKIAVSIGNNAQIVSFFPTKP